MSGPIKAIQVDLQTWSVFFFRSLHLVPYSENPKKTYVDGISTCIFFLKKRVFCTEVLTEETFHGKTREKLVFFANLCAM